MLRKILRNRLVISLLPKAFVPDTPAAAKPSSYKSPSLAVDAMVLRGHRADSFHDVLLVTRKFAPFKSRLAFPGGFVDYGEDPEAACIRELLEECNIRGRSPQLVGVAGKPGRDPRKHVVSICYRVDVDPTAEVEGRDDAAEAQFYSLCKILKSPGSFAFDHYQTLKSYVDKTFPQYVHCLSSM